GLVACRFTCPGLTNLRAPPAGGPPSPLGGGSCRGSARPPAAQEVLLADRCLGGARPAGRRHGLSRRTTRPDHRVPRHAPSRDRPGPCCGGCVGGVAPQRAEKGPKRGHRTFSLSKKHDVPFSAPLFGHDVPFSASRGRRATLYLERPSAAPVGCRDLFGETTI